MQRGACAPAWATVKQDPHERLHHRLQQGPANACRVCKKASAWLGLVQRKPHAHQFKYLHGAGNTGKAARSFLKG